MQVFRSNNFTLENNVTLSSIVGNRIYLEDTIKAILFSKQKIHFKNVQILSSIPFEHEGIKCIQIPELKSISEYANFTIKQYNDYIKTEYVLHIHSDGFIINPDKWTDEFLNYDYIGALWNLHNANFNPDFRCGNSGFTLISKKFLEIAQKFCPAPENGESDDYTMCQKYRHIFTNHGLKFATDDIAAKFSIEDTSIPEAIGQTHSDRSTLKSFGFHAKGSDATNYLNDIKF